MERVLPWLVCAACWTSPAPVAPVIASDPPPEPTARRCAQNRVSGTLYEKATPDEPLVGATVVVTGKGVEIDDDFDVAITDAQGRFMVARRRGVDRITVYYADAMFTARIPTEACGLVARLPLGLGTSGETVDLVFEPKQR